MANLDEPIESILPVYLFIFNSFAKAWLFDPE